MDGGESGLLEVGEHLGGVLGAELRVGGVLAVHVHHPGGEHPEGGQGVEGEVWG